MTKHTVAGVEYTYYTRLEAEDAGIEFKDWRSGQEGEYVLTDDEMVVPLIRRGPTQRRWDWYRIPTGTFIGSPGSRMTSEVRENRTSFGGKKPDFKNPERPLTKRERDFTNAYIRLWDANKAYEIASGRNPEEVGFVKRAAHFAARANVQAAVTDRIRELAQRQGVDEEMVIRG